MVKAIRIHEFGGPEKMKIEDVEVGDPGPGEIRIKHEAISVHFADLLIRQGVYFIKPDLPATMGLEAVGVIEAVGEGVDNLKPGDAVGYTFSMGSYCERRVMPALGLIKLPEGLDPAHATAGLLRGLTAQYLLRQTYKVKKGDVVLVHAAAGGMGSLLTTWSKHLGATVIGTVGSAPKAEIAQANGCDHVINYTDEDFAQRVGEITDGGGVNVVYDSVGKDTYEGNITCLKPIGTFVNYGHASGLLPPIDAMELNKKSLIFTKTSLKDYAAQPGKLPEMAAEVFDAMKSGALKVKPTTYALADAAQAHADMGARKTTGQIVLLPR